MPSFELTAESVAQPPATRVRWYTPKQTLCQNETRADFPARGPFPPVFKRKVSPQRRLHQSARDMGHIQLI
jgi:hypothetical protein